MYPRCTLHSSSTDLLLLLFGLHLGLLPLVLLGILAQSFRHLGLDYLPSSLGQPDIAPTPIRAFAWCRW